jgi:hypothetical protein
VIFHNYVSLPEGKLNNIAIVISYICYIYIQYFGAIYLGNYNPNISNGHQYR